MWLAFVMAIMPAGMDGRGMIGPFKTEAACVEYLSQHRKSDYDHCGFRRRLTFGKLD